MELVVNDILLEKGIIRIGYANKFYFHTARFTYDLFKRIKELFRPQNFASVYNALVGVRSVASFVRACYNFKEQ